MHNVGENNFYANPLQYWYFHTEIGKQICFAFQKKPSQ